ncbi:hypothetical protein CJF42_18865 [Pseudoalteromonas sp. NBT06-2]|uniref:M90 family metallopeptidase n=1 Tax=Pseudoalteromonas sp. NBT06-2 TaxID=2025950 RepID=UPI000BA71F43|nr:M90 family metallopeptidase [Pseudoalteromonas sp. NBT06-2]PAJ72860.1 hypothetical protein CJF42_18865 [Pseudoalteromonas sp. NBT06-2]
MINIFLILVLIAVVITYWQWNKIKIHFWQKKYIGLTLTKSQKKLLLKVMPIYKNMTNQDRVKLEQHILWFLDNISFLGRGDLKVNPGMRLVVAANACLLVLNKPWPIYKNVKQVLLYPSAYYAKENKKDGAGLVSFHNVVRQGESWPGGTLVLSWHDVLAGNRLPEDGHNLVFHEFAHQLDQQTGFTSGTPQLKTQKLYKQWAQVFNRAFNQLKTHLAYGIPNVIHRYGATNEAEFFAVLTETFIEKPAQLQHQDPELYQLMLDYYEFDPRQWV